MEGGDGETEEGDVESWDEVLEMVTTLWDDGWGKGGTGEEDDPDFISDSLQRWPLLRPPVGFGGSHPPSSAASELSLTELERRARELDSDLEHLDLSQPQQDILDLYQTTTEPQRERGDMYQTHPGPQREKTAFTTVGSRSQVSLELGALASSTSDPDRSPGHWSAKSARTSAAVTSSNKEDSSPDSNLTLESESSGIFLSSSNQSQEEGGSDSDQPISGSDLGSSNTSLEKDSDDGGLKEWGREESAELQWCYPSLLNTSQHEDIDVDAEGEEAGLPNTGGGAEKKLYKTDEQDVHLELLFNKNIPDHSDTADSTVLTASLSETIPTRKRVTVIGSDSPLPLSPSKPLIKHLQDPAQKPNRPSGLHCGDFDPFVQSDSFVYLAVSARPGPQSEVTRVADVPIHGTTKQESIQPHLDGKKTPVSQSNPEWEAKMTQMSPQKPEEGDFLCTDSFVYLAAPACFLLGPDGTTSYSGRNSASGGKSSSTARAKRPPAELGWDEETTEPEVPTEPSGRQDKARKGPLEFSNVPWFGMPEPESLFRNEASPTSFKRFGNQPTTWYY
ncbi:unnamed protein product [Tetraodon nigroviridis]|uniref:Chromosome 10 SCAF15095, whole genome shotgun sequence n=1 Tax=Tetraodon nigroviridis TaxID=99883 RepID=Q4RGM9_TETNG|nr:unnamed protein product [Tetraodon nigroviridis]